MSRAHSRPRSAAPSRHSRTSSGVARSGVALDTDARSALTYAFEPPSWAGHENEALQSVNQRFYKEGFSKEVHSQLRATPAAGARSAERGVEERIFRQDEDTHDMTNLLQHRHLLHTNSTGARQIHTIYQTSHPEEPALRYLRHKENTKKLSKEQQETRWHRSLLQWLGREDDNVSMADTNFSVLPAGKRTAGRGRKETEKTEKAKRISSKKKNFMAETQFEEPSAWAVDRNKESKESQYLSQCHRSFVKHVAGVIKDVRGRFERSQQTSNSIYASLEQDDAVPLGAQESSYQGAYGKARKRPGKSKVFHDI